MEANKYLIFVVMAIGICYSCSVKNLINKRNCILALTVLLTCFSGFRSWRMGDMLAYCNGFVACNLPDWELDFTNYTQSAGLQLFYRIIGQAGMGFEVCVFLTAVFSSVALAVLVYRYSPSPYWSYVIYLAMTFYLFSLSGMKQTIAMAFVMLAMSSVLERRPIRFLLLVGAATLFHQPALIFIIAYPFAHKKIDVWYFAIVLAMIAVVYYQRENNIELATDMYYGDEMEFEADGRVGGRLIVMVLIMILAMVLRPLRNYDAVYQKIFSMMVLAALIQYFSMYDNVFTRLADYYYQFSVLFVPLMLQPGKEQAKERPQHVYSIRYWSQRTYVILSFGITAFAIWFYFSNVEACAYVYDFKFLWQDTEKTSRELLKETIQTYYGGY